MAEKEGFEPSVEFNPHTHLAGEHLQPLGHLSAYKILAEEVGFEPTDACTSTVFKTAAFDHSATPPRKLKMKMNKAPIIIVKNLKLSIFLIVES